MQSGEYDYYDFQLFLKISLAYFDFDEVLKYGNCFLSRKKSEYKFHKVKALDKPSIPCILMVKISNGNLFTKAN